MDSRAQSTAWRPSRREFVAVGVGAFGLAGIGFGWRRRHLVRRSIPAMGTIADVAVVHRDRWYAQQAIDAAFRRLQLVEGVLTRFDTSSDIGRANRFAEREGVPVSRETARVLREAIRWSERTDGAFDPCLGGAIGLWSVTQRTTPPPPERVRALAGRRLYRSLDVDVAGGRPTVRFHDPEVVLDLGGIGKGYGVDEAVRTLRAWGIDQAVVNLGGDLYALGRSIDGDPWQVGIRDPGRPSTMARTLSVADEAVATSGDYLQYFEHGGRRYHHLLDPTTGAPAAGSMQSLTVTAVRCMDADAAATAMFGRAPDATATMPAGVRVAHVI